MKKVSFLVAALAASALSVNAQKAYEGTRFLDNWYVGVKGGVTTPTAHSAFWPNMRAETGIELGKQITPVLGVSFEGLTGINTSFSKTAFDDLNLGVLGKINLNNLFGGYNGEPRLFEVEGIAGFGWGHDFVNSSMGADRSYMLSRLVPALTLTWVRKSMGCECTSGYCLQNGWRPCTTTERKQVED